MEFTIGADPEIFMGMGGRFISAHSVIPGTKKRPYKVDKGAVQVDGMALEFNVDPSSNYEEFVDKLEAVQQQLKAMLPEGMDFLTSSTVEFDDIFVKNVPGKALRLGCEPDYNAYTIRQNKKPDSSAFIRTAGGHIHVGGIDTSAPFSDGHMTTSARLARLLDEKIGVYSLLWDKDDKRRSLYGQAGSFRPKYYGMEYRSLSNAWLFNKNIIQFIYDGLVEALELMFVPNYETDPVIQEVINSSNREHPILKDMKAKSLMKVLT